MATQFRTVGAWGAGKGSNLTAAEVDENFWELVERLDALENDPPTAISIADVTVVGNQMTFTMTDSSMLGPFTLPTASWHARAGWASVTFYQAFDVFSYQGGLYLVLRGHTSAATFDPFANDGAGHDFYFQLLAPPAAPELPYDVGMFWNFSIPVDGSLMLQHIAARDFVIPGDFYQSAAYLVTAATSQTLEIEIKVNDTLIGTVTFDPSTDPETDGGQFGVYAPLSPGNDIQVLAGHRVRIVAPSLSPAVQDDTALGLSITLAARTGTIA